MVICDSGNAVLRRGSWPDTGRGQSPRATASRPTCPTNQCFPLREIVEGVRPRINLTLNGRAQSSQTSVSAAKRGAALRYARYGSELVQWHERMTRTQLQRSFSCTVRQNANFAHRAFQEVPRACLQLLGHSVAFEGSRRLLVGVKKFSLQRSFSCTRITKLLCLTDWLSDSGHLASCTATGSM